MRKPTRPKKVVECREWDEAGTVAVRLGKKRMID